VKRWKEVPEGNARARPTVLAFMAIIIWLYNGLVYRQGEDREESILSRTVSRREPTYDPIANMPKDASIMWGSGMYQFSGIVQDEDNDRIYRSAVQSTEIDSNALAGAFGYKDWFTFYRYIRSKSKVAQGRKFAEPARVPRAAASSAWFTQSRQRTSRVEDREVEEKEEDHQMELDEPSTPVTRTQWIDTENLARLQPQWRLKAPTPLSGRDVEERGYAEEPGVDPIPLSAHLERMWQQFTSDVLQTIPNRRNRHRSQSWCLMDFTDRRASEIHWLKTVDLRDLFFQVIAKSVTQEEWNSQFDQYFPDRAKMEDRSKLKNEQQQHWIKCEYFADWRTVLDTLEPPDALPAVRNIIKREFNKLAWVPKSAKDRIWFTAKGKAPSSSVLIIGDTRTREKRKTWEGPIIYVRKPSWGNLQIGSPITEM
jgi:hypothetical protein